MRRGAVPVTGFLTIVAALDVLGILPTHGIKRIVKAISRKDDDPPDSGAGGTGEGSNVVHVDFSKGEVVGFVAVTLLALAAAYFFFRRRPQNAY